MGVVLEGVNRVSFILSITPKPGTIEYPPSDGEAPARGGEPVGCGFKAAGLSSGGSRKPAYWNPVARPSTLSRNVYMACRI